MSAYEEEGELIECPGCGGELRVGDTCGECGWSVETAEAMAIEEQEKRAEPVFARPVELRPFPVHEAAWCPYCVAWLGTFPSKEEARAYERSLEFHPFEFCVRRIAKLNGSEEWRLRHHAGRFGSLAAMKPPGPRVPPGDDAHEEARA